MARPKKLKTPKTIYAAIKNEDGQVLGLDTNKNELADKVNATTPASLFTLVAYVPQERLLKYELARVKQKLATA